MSERVMTKSTGKMRDWILSLYTPNTGEMKVQGLDILDEIEREIAERYVELPVDADGVPWHIGDMVEGHGKVHSLDLNCHGWSFFGVENAIDPAIHRHAKPRTIVDVLRDAGVSVAAVSDVAAEILELMEVDA